MQNILISSGLIQVTFAIALGWVLTGLYSGMKSVGPLKNARRLLQCHLDNIFMALLQMAIAAVFPALPILAGWLLVIGSWTNPQLFLYQATSAGNGRDLPGISVLALASFAILSAAYGWLLLAWFEVV